MVFAGSQDWNMLTANIRVLQAQFTFGYSGTRGANKLHLYRPRTDFYRKSMVFAGSQDWNMLTANIRVLQAQFTFRSTLRKNISSIFPV